MQGISPQAVYQAANKGKLKIVVDNNKKYVVIEPEEIKPVDKVVGKSVDEALVKDLMKQLKSKDKDIKRLTKQLLKCSQSKEDVLLTYIKEIKQMQLPPVPPVVIDEDVIDVPVKKKSKKRKKSKKKK